MGRMRHAVPTERYWLDETDPAELRRRARDWDATAHFGLAEQFRERANQLERATPRATGAGMSDLLLCQDCISLMHEALNLTVRGRKLDMAHNRENTLAASSDPDAWKTDGTFDRYVERHNAECEPWCEIEPRSLTVQLWAEDQFQRDLWDW